MFFKKKQLPTSGKEPSKAMDKLPHNLDPQPHNDDRYLNQSVSIHNWQVMARLLVALLAMSMFFNGYYMMQSKFIPVPIEVDKLGQAVVLGPVTEMKPIDTERVIRTEIADFIDYSRSVTGDYILQKKRLRWLGARVPNDSSTRRIIEELHKKRDPYETAKGMTINAEHITVLRQTEKTYQAEWEEVSRKLSGEVVSVEHWKALLSYELKPQSKLEDININPFGFYATELSWSKIQ